MAAGLQSPKSRHGLFRLIPLQLGLLFLQLDDCDIRLPFWFEHHEKIKYIIYIWMKLMGKQNACGFPYIFGQFVFLDMLIAFLYETESHPVAKCI